MMSVTLILDFVLPKSETEIFDQSLDSSPSSKNYFHFLLQPFKSLSRFTFNINYIIVRSSRSQIIALMTSRSRATKPSTVRGQIDSSAIFAHFQVLECSVIFECSLMYECWKIRFFARFLILEHSNSRSSNVRFSEMRTCEQSNLIIWRTSKHFSSNIEQNMFDGPWTKNVRALVRVIVVQCYQIFMI